MRRPVSAHRQSVATPGEDVILGDPDKLNDGQAVKILAN
jgi:hypothetical protein